MESIAIHGLTFRWADDHLVVTTPKRRNSFVVRTACLDGRARRQEDYPIDDAVRAGVEWSPANRQENHSLVEAGSKQGASHARNDGTGPAGSLRARPADEALTPATAARRHR